MKAVLWEKGLEEKRFTTGCEKCNKIISKAWLISPENKQEEKELRLAWKLKPRPNNMICIHPDNVLLCQKCFSETFSILECRILLKKEVKNQNG